MQEPKNIGECPICARPMLDDGFSINRHHFLPRSEGGKEQYHCHRVCHDQIHALWSNKELASTYQDASRIRQDPRMQKFLTFIKNKHPAFYLKTKSSNHKKKKM